MVLEYSFVLLLWFMGAACGVALLRGGAHGRVLAAFGARVSGRAEDG